MTHNENSRVKSGISTATVTKMGKCVYVFAEVLMTISIALNCTMYDIAEIVQEQ